MREALSLAIGDEAAEKAAFVENVELPAEMRELIAQQALARSKVEEQQALASRLQQLAAKTLAGWGLSLRDAGELLGVSHVMVAKAAAR